MAQRDKEYKRLELLFKMLIYYLDRAYSDVELGIELETHDSNVWRIRRIMADELEIPIQESPELRGKYFIRKDFQMRYIHFSREEMASLYLAARRLQQQTKTSQEHVAVALKKLANAMHKPFAESLIKAAGTVKEQEQDNQQEQVFSDLVTGWLDKTPVRIFHHVLHGARRDYVVHPYHIEPSPWGDGNYLIGYSEYHKKIVRFKITRIEKVVQAPGAYREPDEFDVQTFLKHAWGIWSTDEAPVTVRLRFNKWAIPRLTESNWPQAVLHPPAKDGSQIWEIQVAEWREMESWVKGWGSQVEVLEPVELRNRLVSEVRRLARKYEIITKPQDTQMMRVLRCWGKTTSDVDIFHPAVYHMLDVGHVARTLLDSEAPRRWRRVLATTLNTSEEKLIEWLPYVVALHDIGKISVAFQSSNKLQKERMIQEKFAFAGWPVDAEAYHATISQAWFMDTFANLNPPLTRILRETFGEMLGGHHGRWVQKQKLGNTRQWLQGNFEPTEWCDLRAITDDFVSKALLKIERTDFPQPRNVSAAVMALTGFTILCDWLGSDQRYFRPEPEMDIEDYLKTSSKRAEQALQEYGFLYATNSNAPTDSATLFSDLGSLRSLQVAIDEIPEQILQEPCLAIIEAPTGEGKTEAALALAHRIAQITGTDELYCALPTMATSNQMFRRLEKHLRIRLKLPLKVKLVHGQAYLVEDELRSVAEMQPMDNGDGSNTQDALTWFNSSKKGLVSPFGVGTIDQVELAALNVKHLALRMVSLAGKVVIIDEVHAYDTYMTTILEQVLRWLRVLGTSVILLSATLPLEKRRLLAQAYGVEETNPLLANEDYPSVLVCGASRVWLRSPAAWQKDRTIFWQELHLGDKEAKEKAAWLLNSVRNGGCASWVTNTVRRAQRIFAELLVSVPPDVELKLLHSQFPLDERQRIETDLNDTYGPDGKRPLKGIVVGTQVLEQSLDLDFDIMVSDLSPIDLLLQRAGRLHRHQRPSEIRYEHQQPCLWVNFEQTVDGGLKLGSDRSIYAEYFQQKTLIALKEHPQIHLPDDYRTLIKAVYSGDAPDPTDPLHKAWDDLDHKEKIARNQAKDRLIPDPKQRESFSVDAANQVKFEEDENKAAWIVAQTRLGEESVNVIPLEFDGNIARITTEGEPIWVDIEAPKAIQLAMLRRNLRISQQHLVNAIKAFDNHGNKKLFTESTLLKEFYPLWMKNGKVELNTPQGNIFLRLDPHLGLTPDSSNQEADE